MTLALASEGEENQGIVSGKIDETIAGELFQHALTSSVVALLNAKGEGAKDSLGGLQGLAIDGEDLAEFDEAVRLGAAKGAETELGADLADTKSGACGSLGFATGAGRKRVGGMSERCSRLSWVRMRAAFCSRTSASSAIRGGIRGGLVWARRAIGGPK